MGAGKTTFVRHLLHALGVAGRVKSPTYAVLESYECPQGRAAPSPPPAGVKQSGEATFACELPGLLISHFDFYRFNDAREWHDAGFRDVFAAPGLKLAEWPEKAAAVLPPPDLALHLHARDERWRDVTLQAHSECGLALLRA